MVSLLLGCSLKIFTHDGLLDRLVSRDLEIIETELMLSDIETLEKRAAKLGKAKAVNEVRLSKIELVVMCLCSLLSIGAFC